MNDFIASGGFTHEGNIQIAFLIFYLSYIEQYNSKKSFNSSFIETGNVNRIHLSLKFNSCIIYCYVYKYNFNY